MDAQPIETPLRAEKVAKAKSRAMNIQAERTADVRATSGALGRGKAKAKAEPESSSDEEMMGYGRSMSEHIKKTYGDRFHKHFVKGMGRIVAPVYGNPAIPNVPVGFNNTVAQKAHSRLSEQQDEILEKGYANQMSKSALAGSGKKKGKGKLEIIHHPEGEGETISGGVATGRYEGQGKVDKRKARGAMLKKIMAEKGCNLVEATRYMKEHGVAY